MSIIRVKEEALKKVETEAKARRKELQALKRAERRKAAKAQEQKLLEMAKKLKRMDRGAVLEDDAGKPIKLGALIDYLEE